MNRVGLEGCVLDALKNEHGFSFHRNTFLFFSDSKGRERRMAIDLEEYDLTKTK
jgi:hypothetical protein